MLSKEEIEKAKENLTFFNEGDYITKEMSDSKNVLLIYIDQLELNKQKLIEKLEEDIKYYECDLLRLKQIGIDENDEQVITDKILIDEFKEILSILKGE